MSQKLLIVVISALVLGGCSLTDGWQKEAARDEQLPVQSELSQTEDPKLQAVPSVDNDNSLEGIEEDMANTEFYDEDYSDLEL